MSIVLANSNGILKKGIWLYMFLLIFEGGLRKWVFPSLSTPLLIVRDPIALWLVLTAWKKGVLPQNRYLSGVIAIGIISIFTAVVAGHGNFYIALFGARALLIHFPLIFVIGRVFRREDVLEVGRMILWLVLPMTFLIILQFYSPQSSWVNRGVGGDIAGAGFGGALDFFRPPGTFSFTNGTTLFYGLAASFIIFFLINAKHINRFVLISSTICLIVAIPLSISRGLFFQVCVCLAFALYAMSRNSKYIIHIITAFIGGGIILAILSRTGLFLTATEVFMARFTDANEQEGGLNGVLGSRYLGGLLGALTGSLDVPLFGHGLGISTNVGILLLNKKQSTVIPDEEWFRTVYELGPLLGLSLIMIRVGLDIKIALACFKKLATSDLLPWMLMSFGILTILQAQWAQPTSLGFCILVAGLLISSLKSETIHYEEPNNRVSSR